MSTTVTAPRPVAARRPLYMALSGLMALIAIVGFWPRYFGPLVLGTLVQPLLIHIHATVFIGWLVLFFLQAYFAATKRVRLHLAVGQIGIWYGAMLVIVGLTTGVLRSAEHLPDANGTAERLLYQAIADMVMFGVFFGIAIWYRKKPKVHRPAMVVAATSLLIAAVGRMTFLPSVIPLRIGVWAIPVLIAMGVEFKNTRRVHPIYVLGLAVFVVRRYSVPVVAPSATWASFAHWVFGMVA